MQVGDTFEQIAAKGSCGDYTYLASGCVRTRSCRPIVFKSSAAQIIHGLNTTALLLILTMLSDIRRAKLYPTQTIKQKCEKNLVKAELEICRRQ